MKLFIFKNSSLLGMSSLALKHSCLSVKLILMIFISEAPPVFVRNLTVSTEL